MDPVTRETRVSTSHPVADVKFSLPCFKRGDFVKTWRNRWIEFDGNSRTARFWASEQEMREGRVPRSQHIILKAANIAETERENGIVLYYEGNKATFLSFSSAHDKSLARQVFDSISATEEAGSGGSGRSQRSGSAAGQVVDGVRRALTGTFSGGRAAFNSMMNDTVAGLETYEAAALEEELSGGLAFLPDDEFRGAALQEKHRLAVEFIGAWYYAVKHSGMHKRAMRCEVARIRQRALLAMHQVRPMTVQLMTATLPEGLEKCTKVQLIFDIENRIAEAEGGRQLFCCKLGPFPVVHPKSGAALGAGGGEHDDDPRHYGPAVVHIDEQVVVPGVAQYGAMLHLTMVDVTHKSKQVFLGQVTINLGQKVQNSHTGHFEISKTQPFLWKNGTARAGLKEGSLEAAGFIPRLHPFGALAYRPRRKPRSEGLVVFKLDGVDAWRDRAEDASGERTTMSEEVVANTMVNGFLELEILKRDDEESFSGFLQYRCSGPRSEAVEAEKKTLKRRNSERDTAAADAASSQGIGGKMLGGMVGLVTGTVGAVAGAATLALDTAQLAADTALKIGSTVAEGGITATVATVNLLASTKVKSHHTKWRRVWVSITQNHLSLFEPPNQRYGKPFRTVSAINCYDTGTKSINGARQLLRDPTSDAELLVREQHYDNQGCRLRPRRLAEDHEMVLYHEFKIDDFVGTRHDHKEGRRMWGRLLHELATPNHSDGMPTQVCVRAVPSSVAENVELQSHAGALTLEATLGTCTEEEDVGTVQAGAPVTAPPTLTEAANAPPATAAEMSSALEGVVDGQRAGDTSAAVAGGVTLELRAAHTLHGARWRRFRSPRAIVHHTITVRFKSGGKVLGVVRVHVDDIPDDGTLSGTAFPLRKPDGHEAGTVELEVMWKDRRAMRSLEDGHTCRLCKDNAEAKQKAVAKEQKALAKAAAAEARAATATAAAAADGDDESKSS